uniref:Putative secreted protein n=1 Tax=Amblyomma americanum TaxID=6943 RepID=A0A0C9RVR5_AMBAM
MMKLSAAALPFITYILVAINLSHTEEHEHIGEDGCFIGSIKMAIGESARYTYPCVLAICKGPYPQLILKGCPDSPDDFGPDEPELNRRLWPFCCDYAERK